MVLFIEAFTMIKIFGVFFALFFLCGIIFHMVEQTWGDLPESQISNRLITQAISDAISAHEADPEAHLGVGESLEAHKSNDIIDHPPGSVLADKWSMTEWQLTEDFKLLSLWVISGDVSNSNWPTLQLYVEYGATDESKIYLDIISPAPFISNDHDILFQILAQFNNFSNSHYDATFGLGVEDGGTSGGFGFVVIDGDLKALVGLGATEVFSDIITVDLSDAHIFRAQYVAGLGVVQFFIDGTQVAELEKPVGAWNDDARTLMQANVSETNDGTIFFSDLYVSRAVI